MMFQRNDEDIALIGPARTLEPDRYLAALLAPEAVQADLLAIAGFAAELARIPAVVKEPMMGEIRLQWWRDALAQPSEQASGHAVADRLRAALARHRLSVPVLHAMTEARAFDLYQDPMTTEAAFEGYLDKTAGAPFALALHILGADVPAALADHAGRAYGRIRLLATLPTWLARGRLPLPPSYVDNQDTEIDAVLAGRLTPTFRRAIDRLIGEADRHVEAARDIARGLPRRQRIALLPLATIPPYRAVLRRPVHDPLRMLAEISPLTRITRIARAHWLAL